MGESRFAGPGARRAGLPASAPGDAGGAAGVWAETALGRPASASALRVSPPFALGLATPIYAFNLGILPSVASLLMARIALDRVGCGV